MKTCEGNPKVITFLQNLKNFFIFFNVLLKRQGICDKTFHFFIVFGPHGMKIHHNKKIGYNKLFSIMIQNFGNEKQKKISFVIMS